MTTYGFDAVGNRTSMTDGNNHTTTFLFDGHRRRTGTLLPDGESISSVHDGLVLKEVGCRSSWFPVITWCCVTQMAIPRAKEPASDVAAALAPRARASR